jgi:hypothetical protein
MSAKIIKFPKKYKGKLPEVGISTPTTKTELAASIVKVRTEHTEILINDITQFMLTRLRNDGINLTDLGEIANVDVTLIREAIRATILRFYHIQYPFQKMANDHFEAQQKKATNIKEIEKLNPLMKDDLEPEPVPPAPMVG